MNILTYNAANHNAVSWYRSIGVYKYIGTIKLSYTQVKTWDEFIDVDVFVLGRPSQRYHMESLDMARISGVFTIVDYDDDIFNINPCSDAYKYAIKGEWNEASMYCLKTCNVITVSTQAIADTFVARGIDAKKIYIIPNAFNDFHKPFNPTLNLTNKFLIRGDVYSWNDLMSQFNTIQRASNKYDLIGLGDLKIFYDHFKFKDMFDYITPPFYFEAIKELNCRVMLKAMMPNIFNASKSNCSWIEATYGGSVLVSSEHIPEFNMPGILQSKYFDIAINKLMEDDAYCETLFEMSVDYIKNNLVLSKVNELRKEILQR